MRVAISGIEEAEFKPITIKVVAVFETLAEVQSFTDDYNNGFEDPSDESQAILNMVGEKLSNL